MKKLHFYLYCYCIYEIKSYICIYKNGKIYRYKNTITDKDVWKIFASTFNTLLKQIQDEQK